MVGSVLRSVLVGLAHVGGDHDGHGGVRVGRLRREEAVDVAPARGVRSELVEVEPPGEPRDLRVDGEVEHDLRRRHSAAR